MKRYYPTDEERERLHRAERMLGIPSGAGHETPDPRAAGDGTAQPETSAARSGIRRMTITAWRELWQNDPEEWMREIRDRPRRFDEQRWHRAVLRWWNQLPPQRNRSSETKERAGDASLSGVPVLVKDLFDVIGEETRCGSAVLGVGDTGGGPLVAAAERDAWLVALVRGHGCSLQGRTAMNEFAYGIDGRNRVTGDCPHPLDAARISGGSSSGSAWAVAAGVAPLALGSDTGGSIRVPAALCGIYGYRIPWDAHRLAGTFPLSARMDTVGWFASSVEDVQLMLGLTATGMPRSATARDSRPAAGLQEATTETSPSGGITIAAIVPPDVALDAEVRERWDQALSLLHDTPGISVKAVDPPAFLGTDAWKAYNVIGSSDATAVHGEWLDRYQELYDPVVWSLIDRGRQWSADRIASAERTRDEVATYLQRLLATVDVVAMPVTPLASPSFEAADSSFREAVLRLNAPVSLAGLGALTVPLPHDAIRSSGMQLVVPAGGEGRILKVLRRLGR